MAIWVVFISIGYLWSTQGYLHNHLPHLVDAMEKVSPDDPAWRSEFERQEQNVYRHMIYVAIRFIAFFSVLALLLGYGLSRMLTSPLIVLSSAIDRIGKGDRTTAIPVTTRDEYGKVAEALNGMAAGLERSEDVRRRLVADVAHELRTPLTILQGKMELLQQNGRAIAPEELLPMQDELIRLNALVNDLHQLSLAEAGKLPLNRIDTNLLALLERLVALFRSEAEEKDIALRITSEEANASPPKSILTE